MKKKLLEKSVLFMVLCMFGGQDAFGMWRRLPQIIVGGIPKTVPKTTPRPKQETYPEITSPRPTDKQYPSVVNKTYNDELNALNDQQVPDFDLLGTPKFNPAYGMQIYILAKNNNMSVEDLYETYPFLERVENKKEGISDNDPIIKTDQSPMAVFEKMSPQSTESLSSQGEEISSYNDRTNLDSKDNPDYQIKNVYDLHPELEIPDNKTEVLSSNSSTTKKDQTSMIVYEKCSSDPMKRYEETMNLSYFSFKGLSYLNTPYICSTYLVNMVLNKSEKTLEMNTNRELILVTNDYEKTMYEMEEFFKNDRVISMKRALEIVNKSNAAFKNLSKKMKGYTQRRTFNLLQPMITSCFIEVASSAIFDQMFSDAVNDQSVYNKFQDFDKGLEKALDTVISALDKKIDQMQEKISHADHLDKERLLTHLNKEIDLKNKIVILKNKAHRLSDIEKENFMNHSYFYTCDEAMLAEFLGMGKENLGFLRKYANGLAANKAIDQIRAEEVSLIDYLENELKSRLDQEHNLVIDNLLKEIKQRSVKKYQTEAKIGVDIYSDGLIEKLLSKNAFVKIFATVSKKVSLHKAEEKALPTKTQNYELDSLDIPGTLELIMQSYIDESNNNVACFEKEEDALRERVVLEDNIKEENITNARVVVINKVRCFKRERFNHENVTGFKKYHKTMNRISLQKRLINILDQLSVYEKNAYLINDLYSRLYILTNSELERLINDLTILLAEQNQIENRKNL